MAKPVEVVQVFFFAIIVCFIYACLSVTMISPKEKVDTSRGNTEILITKPEKLISNDDYLANYIPQNFTLDDTDQLNYLQGSIAVLPKMWGYSAQKGNKIFPPYTYPQCSSLNPSPENSSINLDVHLKRFSMVCPDMSRAVYFLGPDSRMRFTNSYSMKKYIQIKSYKEVVTLEPHHEWVYASCKEGKGGFEMFDMKPSYNKKAVLESKENDEQPAKKRMTIAMITLDSFSRRHFFRKLPKTVEYLNRLESGEDYKVDDLKIHNIQGWDTARNQAYIFGEYFPGFSSRPRFNDRFRKLAIWNKLRKQGFITLLGFEACAVKMHRMLGMHPDADHVVNPFYCTATHLTDYSSYKDATKVQRCIGQHMSHYYLMKYSIEFDNIYKNRNKWIYNHFTAAHEYTGQHASTLDDDLVWYIQELIKSSKKNGNELVIFLGGDHGMRYGNFLRDPEALQEQRLCAMFVIASRSFMNDLKESYAILEHNSNRLTTKGDLRKTVLDLAEYQSKSKKNKQNGRYYNIFIDSIPNSRTCSDAKIDRVYCSHYNMQIIPSYYYDSRDPNYLFRNNTEISIGSLILQITDEYIQILNKNNYTPTHSPKGYICQKLVLDEIPNAMTENSIAIGGIIKIFFTVKGSNTAEFLIWLQLEEPESIQFYDPNEENISFTVHLKGEKVKVNTLKIERTDSYGGECEKIATLEGLDPEACICNQDRFFDSA